MCGGLPKIDQTKQTLHFHIMWALINKTPYAAERNWTRDKDGVHWWLVALRATFDMAPNGSLKLADEQLPPVLEPEYFGKPGISSLKYDSDLLAFKPKTDVLVHAHAYAPGARAVPTVPVMLRFGSVKKQLLVHGERVYTDGVGLQTSAPRPFLKRPIMYELAFGGSDFSDPDPKNHCIDDFNPVGRGVAWKSERLTNTPAHSIEYPKGNPKSKGPAGFGPIDPAWMPRRKFAGTYDDRWAKTKKPLLPEDYHPAFALSAPNDQQTDKPLAGGERIGLLNMTPEGQLIFELPHIRLDFATSIGRRREQHDPPRLATVLIEAEEKRLSLIWQSVLRVSAVDADYLDATEIVEQESGR
jgi:hypothetical protein